jgi:type IV secretory pathway VirB10-like protein
MPRVLPALALALAALALAGLAARYLAFPDKGPPPAKLGTLTPGQAQGQVGGEGTDQYNGMSEELNLREALKAKSQGRSYVPSPVGGGLLAGPLLPEPGPGDRQEAAPAAPAEAAKAAEEAKEAKEAKALLPLSPVPMARDSAARPRPGLPKAPEADPKARLGDLRGLLSRLEARPAPAQAQIFRKEAPSPPSPATPGPEAQRARSLGLAPGDVLYAVTDLAINSDAPGPVLATVAQGPLRGARLLGAFQLKGSELLIAFSKLIPRGGGPLDLEAVAVDARSGSASVGAKVDTHFLKRWGAFLAAGFVEPFGRALSSGGRRIYLSGDTVVEEERAKGGREAAWEALGAASGRAAGQLEESFGIAPTVTLDRGQPIGVLVLSFGY